MNEFATSIVGRMVVPFDSLNSLAQVFPLLVTGSEYYKQFGSEDGLVILAWLIRSPEFEQLSLISNSGYSSQFWGEEWEKLITYLKTEVQPIL